MNTQEIIKNAFDKFGYSITEDDILAILNEQGLSESFSHTEFSEALLARNAGASLVYQKLRDTINTAIVTRNGGVFIAANGNIQASGVSTETTVAAEASTGSLLTQAVPKVLDTAPVVYLQCPDSAGLQENLVKKFMDTSSVLSGSLEKDELPALFILIPPLCFPIRPIDSMSLPRYFRKQERPLYQKDSVSFSTVDWLRQKGDMMAVAYCDDLPYYTDKNTFELYKNDDTKSLATVFGNSSTNELKQVLVEASVDSVSIQSRLCCANRAMVAYRSWLVCTEAAMQESSVQTYLKSLLDS